MTKAKKDVVLLVGVILMRLTTKGQVTIPQHIREKLGLLQNTEVEFLLNGNTAILRKSKHTSYRGKSLIDHLKGKGSVQMSTDKIMSLTRDHKK